MQWRDGSIMSDKNRAAKNIEVVKFDLTQKTVLMAPPLLFQERIKRNGRCDNSWAAKFLSGQQERMLAIKCSPPFECRDEVLQKPELAVYTCPGDDVESDSTEKHFGLSLSKFQGQPVYADLLYSLANNPFVFRDGEIRRTVDFIDQGTKRAVMVFLFFSPSVGVTSVLQVSADFDRQDVLVKRQLRHYLMLEGGPLTWCAILLQICR